MNAYPLEAPLSYLSPARRVYIVRFGRVYLYPASIVRDIANDRYTMDDDRPWTPSPRDWEIGRLLHERLGVCGPKVDVKRLFALALTIWRNEGGFDETFLIWWESVNTDAHPEWIGAAASVAARELMTFPTFQHRHLVDGTSTNA